MRSRPARDAWGNDWLRPVARQSTASGGPPPDDAAAAGGLWLMGFDGVVRSAAPGRRTNLSRAGMSPHQ